MKVYAAGAAGIVVSLTVGSALGVTDDQWSAGADIALATMAVFATLGAIHYGVRADWRHSEVGRGVLAISTALAAVLVQAAVSRWTGDYPGRQQIRWTIYVTGCIAYLSLTRVFWRTRLSSVRFGR